MHACIGHKTGYKLRDEAPQRISVDVNHDCKGFTSNSSNGPLCTAISAPSISAPNSIGKSPWSSPADQHRGPYPLNRISTELHITIKHMTQAVVQSERG